ncbi:hypothetical protein MD484_g3199, partial [Candolleomyces efflorescens]
MSDDPIPLRIANKKAYVWDIEDVARIRSQYRLCGVLSGTLPHLSQQNVFLGLPLVLQPEEAVLLVELGAAILIDDPSAHLKPSTAQLTKWDTDQQENIKSQIAAVETKNAKASLEHGKAMTEEALRKRREREERKKKALEQATAAGESESPLFISDIATTAAPDAGPSTEGPSAIPYTITVPGPSSSLEWYTPHPQHSYPSIESARTAEVFGTRDIIWEWGSSLEGSTLCIQVTRCDTTLISSRP